MKRRTIALTVVLLLLCGPWTLAPDSPVRAAQHAGSAADTKKCHTVTKKVHGKKTKVKVCTTVKRVPTPMPIATPDQGKLTGPRGIAIDARGTVFVADGDWNGFYPSRIVRVSADGTVLGAFGEGKLGEVIGLTLDGQGNVWVANAPDSTQNPTGKPIEEFSPDGTLIGSFGQFGSGVGQLGGPWGIALAPDGDIYVSDAGYNKVEKYAPDGRWLAEWKDLGAFGLFDAATGIRVDSHGNVYVIDHRHQRIVKFTSDGTSVAEFSGISSNYPEGLGIDKQDNLYVADASGNKVRKLSPDGRQLAVWDVPGIPNQIGVDDQGFVYVTDNADPAIYKYSSDGKIVASWK